MADSDLALISGDVFLSQLDGGFAPPIRLPVGALGISSFAVGDFNGDGLEDLAISTTGECAPTCQWQPSLLLGDGTGAFTLSWSSPISPSPGRLAPQMAVGDFNNDGNLDVAVFNGSELEILLGNGLGQLTTIVSGPETDDIFQLAVADLNGDGILDLAGPQLDGSLAVFLGYGDGGFFNFLIPPQSPDSDSFSNQVVTLHEPEGTPELAVSSPQGEWVFKTGLCNIDAGERGSAVSRLDPLGGDWLPIQRLQVPVGGMGIERIGYTSLTLGLTPIQRG